MTEAFLFGREMISRKILIGQRIENIFTELAQGRSMNISDFFVLSEFVPRSVYICIFREKFGNYGKTKGLRNA